MRTGRPGACLRPSAGAWSAAFTPQKVGAEKRIRKRVGARAFLRPEGRAPSERRPLDAQFLPRAFALWRLCVVCRFEVHFLPSRAFALPGRRGARRSRRRRLERRSAFGSGLARVRFCGLKAALRPSADCALASLRCIPFRGSFPPLARLLPSAEEGSRSAAQPYRVQGLGVRENGPWFCRFPYER